MAIRNRLAAALTESFLAGPWTARELGSRAATLFAEDHPRLWLRVLIGNVLMTFPETAPRPTERRLLAFVLRTRIPKAERVVGSTRLVQPLPQWIPRMQPATGPASIWAVPAIASGLGLADWFGITVGELEWFANRTGWNSSSPREPLRHYRYRWIAKPSGGLRLLESPKPRLKEMQRRILDEILDQVPIHDAAHAFRSGRSVGTYVAPHTGQHVVLHIDLREFFPSVQASRVNATLRTMGYPERVAGLLTGLCTNSTPAAVLETGLPRRRDEGTWLRHRSAHLPQGAPTSPALANLCARKLDARLNGLARAVEAQYTRYADDLVFSGGRDLLKCLPRLRVLINAIVLDEGFEIRHRKTHVMVAGTRQQVAGIRLNEHANIPRETFDALKAILHNCRRFGPQSQNREGHPRFREHLQGRLAYWSAICPQRMARMNRLFDEINWRETHS